MQDKFEVLGVPRRFELDAAELEQRWRALSRELHPDRYATAAPRERVMSLQAATNVNDAYRTLKRPLARAQYLLQLSGMSLDENVKADPELLMEVMELREALSEAKAQGDDAAIEELRVDVQARFDAAFDAVRRGFAAHDRGEGGLEEVREKVIALRYYERFLDEVAPPEEHIE